VSSYTMELREYVEMWTQEENLLSHRERIEKGRKHLFDFPYPMFNENYRNVFETNFIRNFYMREIGFETEELFKFRLETWLIINMPYFNKLFESELLKYNPLTNTDLKINHNKSNDKTQNDNRDRKQIDDKHKTQNDDRDIVRTDDKTVIANENRDITTNDERNIIDNVTKDITGVDKTVKKMDEKEDIKNNNKNETTSTANDKMKNETDNTVTSIGSNDKLVSGSVDNFIRDLESNTPDSRLAITSDYGKGVIEYASKIDEKLETKETDSSENVKSNDKTVGNSKSDTTNIQNHKSDSNDDFTGNKKTDLNESVNKDTVLNDKLVGSKNDEYNSRTDDNKTSDVSDITRIISDDRFSSNVNDKLISDVNDKLVSNINDIEEFIQYSFGKVGSVSYPKLVEEYRATLLRIEKQIFNEMNELFMLVY